MFNEFDKKEMMNDECGFYLYRKAKELPITLDRVDRLVSFVSNYVHTHNKVIKKYEAEGRDATNLIADRDYALYILGIEEKPEKYAKVIL